MLLVRTSIVHFRASLLAQATLIEEEVADLLGGCSGHVDDAGGAAKKPLVGARDCTPRPVHSPPPERSN